MTTETIRHLVILSHPVQGSFNHQIADTYCDTVREVGQEVVLRDLYAQRFDPVLEYVGQVPELRSLDDFLEVRRCDVLTFVYPIWFGLPPAMIKGYVDRVLGAGFQPTKEQLRADSPFLKGKRMLSITTSARPRRGWPSRASSSRCARDSTSIWRRSSASPAPSGCISIRWCRR